MVLGDKKDKNSPKIDESLQSSQADINMREMSTEKLCSSQNEISKMINNSQPEESVPKNAVQEFDSSFS